MPDRRDFLKHGSAGAAGLIVGVWLRDCSATRPAEAAQSAFAPNAFVRISSDDAVTVVVNRSEMGQGVHTALAMLVAEELDCDWGAIRVEAAPVTPDYNDPITGEYLTAGSTSIVSSWTPFRKAGATARLMLLQAAAKRWHVELRALRTERGRVYHDASGQSVSFGALAPAAAREPIPVDVPLKDPGDFTMIGTDRSRLEGRDKVTGAARFSIDVVLPGMLTAVVARPPVAGGTVKSADLQRALATPGVVRVKRVSSGVAVLARDFWSARRGRDALDIRWDHGPNETLSTRALRATYRKLADTAGLIAEDVGDVDRSLSTGSRTLEAVYEVPFLAHAPMEPLNAVARVKEDECEIWAGTEYQTMDQRVAAKLTGLRPDQVRIHTTMLGGAFGRRRTANSDFVAEAVEAAMGERVPVKTIWTREDDIQGGHYRPMFVHKVRAAIDETGLPTAWHQRLVGESVGEGRCSSR
jgi:isoquinoline 1-oxidoreductase beta subunit